MKKTNVLHLFIPVLVMILLLCCASAAADWSEDSAYEDVRSMIAAGEDWYDYGMMYSIGKPAVVRSKPSASSQQIATYAYGSIVYRCSWYKDNGEFIHVSHGDFEGYIHSSELGIAEKAYRNKSCLVSRKTTLAEILKIPDPMLDTKIGSVRLIARSADINQGVICWIDAYEGSSGTPSWGYLSVSEYNTDPVVTIDVFIGGTAASPRVIIYNTGMGLSAIDLTSGNKLWDHDWTSDGIVHSVGSDGTIYAVGVYGTAVTAIDNNGRTKWCQKFTDYPIGVWPVEINLKEDGIYLPHEHGNGAVLDYDGNILRIIPVDDEDWGYKWVKEEYWMYCDWSSRRLYFTLDGVLLNGWQEFGGNTYYFTEKGERVTGKQTIDGEKYEFDDSGVLTEAVRDGLKYRINKKIVSVIGTDQQDMKTVTIPASIKINRKNYKVTAIKANAFTGLKKLASAEIGKNIGEIGEDAFSGCTKLKKVSGMTGVKTIGVGAFENCTSLTAFTIESKVKTIGARAFLKCKKLKEFTVKTTKLTEESVGEDAFATGVKATFKCPKSKLKAYKALFPQKGAHKRSKYK